MSRCCPAAGGSLTARSGTLREHPSVIDPTVPQIEQGTHSREHPLVGHGVAAQELLVIELVEYLLGSAILAVSPGQGRYPGPTPYEQRGNLRCQVMWVQSDHREQNISITGYIEPVVVGLNIPQG